MSDFIVSIAFGGLSDRPPESKVMPLPAKATVLVAPGAGVAQPDQPRRAHRALADAGEAAVAAVGQRLLVQDLDVQPAGPGDLLGRRGEALRVQVGRAGVDQVAHQRDRVGEDLPAAHGAGHGAVAGAISVSSGGAACSLARYRVKA